MKSPLTLGDIAISCIEFSEPGGSDSYTTGFQHIEIITKRNLSQISNKQGIIKEYLFKGKFGDEVYMKWPDKVSLKTTSTPLIMKALSAENTKIHIA